MEKEPIPQATSPLATWLSYLEHLHSKTIDLGLTRVSEVAERMAVLKPAPFVFTVAGTNGKGTTCRTLEYVLIAAGYKVGVYSSPHLVRYTERVRVQGAELPEAAHTASFAEIEAARAYGFSSVKLYRCIILPSALRIALPAYSNEVILMLHSTALAFTATVPDLLKIARDINSATYQPFTAFGIAAVLYLIISYVLISLFRKAEKRWLQHIKPSSTH